MDEEIEENEHGEQVHGHWDESAIKHSAIGFFPAGAFFEPEPPPDPVDMSDEQPDQTGE